MPLEWLDSPVDPDQEHALLDRGFRRADDWVTVDRDLRDLDGSVAFEVRPLDPSDAAERSVLHSVLRELPDPDLRPADAFAALEASVPEDQRAWYTAVHGDVPIGVVLGWIEPMWGTLSAFGLGECARGRGWGAPLHWTALNLLARHGATTYRDQTWTGNARMLRIFARNGCTVIRTFTEYRRSDSPGPR